MLKVASPTSAKHFVDALMDWTESVVIEAEERDKKIIRNLENYFSLRRRNIGTWANLCVCELHLNLPDEAYYHPMIKEMEELIADIVFLDNV